MTTQRGLEPHEYAPYAAYNDGPCRHCERGRYSSIHDQPPTSNEPPARRAGEGEQWEYIETRYGAEARAGQFVIRLHWTGLAGIGDTRATIQQIVTEHNQHSTLVEQRDRLLEAAKLMIAMDNCNYDRDVMRRSGGFKALQDAVDLVEKSSSTTTEREG